MRNPWWRHLLCCIALYLAIGQVQAADPCDTLVTQHSSQSVATRLAAIACEEHQRWTSPFIDLDGHLLNANLYEAEARGLKGGGAPWRRVAFYWYDSGLLSGMGFKDGASDCNYATMSLAYAGLACRGFIVDNPWSAAFISWLMQRAGVPRFPRSAGHYEYVRSAYKREADNPYRFVDINQTTPAVGDLLCYVRANNQLYGYDGLLKAITSGVTYLPMHCDVIVATDQGVAYAIGGNVQQAVSMRMLAINAQGQFWDLPVKTPDDIACSPATADACNFNRQDWAVLLKLKSQEELAQLGPVTPVTDKREQPAAPVCCTQCVLGSDIPRCPLETPQTDEVSTPTPAEAAPEKPRKKRWGSKRTTSDP
jgi:hypothetical protein